ncbi:CapA family protein [Alkaliphilus transvaalensis]|uniref:CapA family protein n=1 Tax=Alkaliphilus transvaalensis TaxID=114628 RepID=UPI00047C2A6C|nr:CapA family protein [Alkaliphilus transvaalensis]
MKKIRFILMIVMVMVGLFSGCNSKDDYLNDDHNNDTIVIEDENQNEKDEHDRQDTQDEENDNEKKNEKNLARIIFVGDTMMDGNVAKVMIEKGDHYPLTEFMPILEGADFVVANLETAVGTSGELMEKTYAFQTNPDRFALFDPINEKLLFSLANNHGMDAPLDETMKELDRMNFKYIGVGQNMEMAFRPHIEEINGVSFAFLAASRVIPVPEWRAEAHKSGMATAYSYEPLISYIGKWVDKVDHVIVSIHWGEELAEIPNEEQTSLNEKLLEAGVRAVIGTHPHVIQEIRWEGNQLTAFSLGNFVFSTSRQAIANDFIALELHLSKNNIESVKAWPGEIKFGLLKHLKEEEDRKRVFGRLQRLSPTIIVDENGLVRSIR